MSATLVEPTIEIRSGDGYQVAEVNFPKRIVTVIAMPYERPTEVVYGDRIVTEVASRSAFNGIEKRAGQIRANRDHSWDKIDRQARRPAPLPQGRARHRSQGLPDPVR